MSAEENVAYCHRPLPTTDYAPKSCHTAVAGVRGVETRTPCQQLRVVVELSP